MVNSKNFSAEELACSCCGSHGVHQWALDKLQLVRDAVARPLTITSAYRCANHPNERSKARPGAHNQGIAFDVYVANGAERYEIMSIGILHGATGVGVDKNFIHLDWRDNVPVAWTY